MVKLVNIWLEEHDGTPVTEHRGVEEPELDADGTFQLDDRRWRWSHSYRALDERTGGYTIYKAARPVDWLAS